MFKEKIIQKNIHGIIDQISTKKQQYQPHPQSLDLQNSIQFISTQRCNNFAQLRFGRLSEFGHQILWKQQSVSTASSRIWY